MMKTIRALTATAAIAALAPSLAVAQAGGEVLLRLRLQPGKAYNVSMTMAQEISQTVYGQAQDVEQETEIGYEMVVTEVDEAGTATAQWTYHTVRFSMGGFMGPIEYDSSQPATDVHPMARGYAALVGQSFVTKMTPDGRVIEASGFDKIMSRIFEELGMPAGPEADAAREQLEKMFGDQAMKDIFSTLVAVYPEEAVSAGDTWTREYVISTGFPIKVEDTYTLRNRSDGVSHIDVSSVLVSDPHAPPMQMGQVSMTFDISGTQTGQLEMNEATGWIVRSQVEQSFSGVVSVGGMAAAAEGMSWPITVRTMMRLETR